MSGSLKPEIVILSAAKNPRIGFCLCTCLSDQREAGCPMFDEVDHGVTLFVTEHTISNAEYTFNMGAQPLSALSVLSLSLCGLCDSLWLYTAFR